MKGLRLVLVTCLLGVGFSPAGAWARTLEGFASVGVGQAGYPEEPVLYTGRESFPWSGTIRLLAEAGAGELHFAANILESLAALPPLAMVGAGHPAQEVARSCALTWEQYGSTNSRVALAADLLELQYRGGAVDLTLGRQPISLATTFYFSPNDLFAPFTAATFFRTYRPGVDALRADFRLAALAQMTLLAVLDYAPEFASSNGWSRRPVWSRTSLLARYNWESGGLGWSLLGGAVRDRTLLGGSFQGELFDWLGVRAEGHYALAEKAGVSEGGRITLGIEHRYAENFDWRLEYHYNGYSSDQVAAYHDRHYGALGMGYQFTPLLTGGLVALVDMNEGSWLYSANFLYSLSDETELSLTGTIPMGGKSTGLASCDIGCQPRQLLLEYRINF